MTGPALSPMFVGAAQPIAEARPIPADVALAYRRYVESHFGEIVVTELAEVMYRAGGREAIAASVAFGDILPTLRYLAKRLNALADTLEAGLS